MEIPTLYHEEKGNIIINIALSLVVLIGFMGLALDIGHLYIVKTELQNAADAAALAAARVMDGNANSLFNARDKAVAVPNKFNFQQQNVIIDPNNVTFSDNLAGPYEVTAVADPATARFVKTVISPQDIGLWFSPVLKIFSAQVRAEAVAGPSSPVQQACNLIPLALCDDPTKCNFADPNDPLVCPDPEFIPGELYTVKLPPGNHVTPGNYLILDLGGSGCSAVREWLAGGYTDCLNLNDNITTEPGQCSGPVSQGLNTRFAEYKGGLSEDDYSHDSDVREGISYSLYEDGAADPHGDGIYGRRIMAVPLVDCSTWGPGKTDVTITDFGCFFIKEKVPGNNKDKAPLQLEFIDRCVLSDGVPSLEDRPGPIIIQLYR